MNASFATRVSTAALSQLPVVLRLEPGAHLTGQVLAAVVVVGGELQGNIESAKRVDVLEGGVIVGDVKAGSITVAAGSRMRGHVEFGWDDEKLKKLGTAAGS